MFSIYLDILLITRTRQALFEKMLQNQQTAVIIVPPFLTVTLSWSQQKAAGTVNCPYFGILDTLFDDRKSIKSTSYKTELCFSAWCKLGFLFVVMQM